MSDAVPSRDADGRPLRTLAFVAAAGFFLFANVGCATFGHHESYPFSKPDPRDALPVNVTEIYTVACPDVISIEFRERPGWNVQVAVEPDGEIELGRIGRVRVEGLPIPEIGPRIAERAGLAPSSVQARVASYRSRQLYLYGQIGGNQRVLDYRGPETIAEVLKRAGVSETAALNQIHVVRARVAEGGKPDVYPIDLKEILNGKDDRTNLRVRPLDHIYVGEMPRAQLGRVLPPIVQPVYRLFTRWFGKIREPAPVDVSASEAPVNDTETPANSRRWRRRSALSQGANPDPAPPRNSPDVNRIEPYRFDGGAGMRNPSNTPGTR
jgi:protein involved in polysaccharide export with SLBB domain